MAKERIYELAKELKMPSKQLVKLANDQGMSIKSHMSSVTPDQAAKLRQAAKGGNNQKAKKSNGSAVKQHRDVTQNHAPQKKDSQPKQKSQQRPKVANNDHHGDSNKKHAQGQQPTANTNQHSVKKNNQQQRNNRHDNNQRGGNNQNRAHWFGNGKKNKKRNKKNRNNQRMKNVAPKQPTQRKDRPLPDVLEYTEGMNAQDLAKILHRSAAEIVKKLFMLGVMVNQNQSLDKLSLIHI